MYASLDCALLSSASAPQASPCQPDRDFQTLGCQCRTQRPPCCLPAACLCRLHAQLIQPCKLPHHESWSSAICVCSATFPCCGALHLAACRGGGAQRAQRRRAPGGRRAAARLPGRAQGQPGAAGRGPGRRGAQGRRQRRGCAGAPVLRALACAPGRARRAGSRRGRMAGAGQCSCAGACQLPAPLRCVWATRRGCPAASLHARGYRPSASEATPSLRPASWPVRFSNCRTQVVKRRRSQAPDTGTNMRRGGWRRAR